MFFEYQQHNLVTYGKGNNTDEKSRLSLVRVHITFYIAMCYVAIKCIAQMEYLKLLYIYAINKLLVILKNLASLKD